MVSDNRRRRMEASFLREVAEILQAELKMPLPGLVTISGVELSRDASEARVRYTVLGPEGDRAKVAHRLRQLAPFIQREVSRRLRLRVTPQVRFEFDDRVGKGAKVLELLADLDKEHGTDSDDRG